MRKVKFQVTQQHIDDGEPGNDHSCPVALCIREWALQEAGEVIEVHVGNDQIQVGFLPMVEAPGIVKNFVEYFDDEGHSGIYIRPFEFELDLDMEEVS